MASVQELLLSSLKDLEMQDLKEFQWHIKKNTRIPNSEMENADRLKTVDKIVDFFGVEEAVKITIENLRKINKNNLAKELENKHRKAQAEGSTEDPELAGASSTGVTTVQVIQAPEYQTREEFLQCFHLFTLDPNTVHSTLSLSEGNTVITHTGANYRYPDHPDRFDFHAQALCRESISGRCYWEVEYSGSEGVHIAVAYKSIKRKGMRSDSRFGYNNQSWRFYCSNSSSSFRHNSTHSVLPVVSSRKIGVYVDHGAGILSFFSVSDKMSLIHRVQTTFTQPLCVGFGVQNHTTLKMCRPIL